ncbi:MAG TPA: hypothetical protein VIL43_06570 [Burkholderiales bacterium]
MSTAVRLAGYTLAVFLATASFRPLVGYFGLDFFQENGPAEWIEFAVLFTVTAVFLTAARRTPRFRQLFVLLAAAAILAQFRELDAILDQTVPWLGWKIGFAVLPAAALYARRHWATLRAQAAEFMTTRACGMLWGGIPDRGSHRAARRPRTAASTGARRQLQLRVQADDRGNAGADRLSRHRRCQR